MCLCHLLGGFPIRISFTFYLILGHVNSTRRKEYPGIRNVMPSQEDHQLKYTATFPVLDSFGICCTSRPTAAGWFLEPVNMARMNE